MKIIVKYNKKTTKWTIFIDNKVLFNSTIIIKKKNNYSIFLYNYLIILKILRQFGLKKPIKNCKQYL